MWQLKSDWCYRKMSGCTRKENAFGMRDKGDGVMWGWYLIDGAIVDGDNMMLKRAIKSDMSRDGNTISIRFGFWCDG